MVGLLLVVNVATAFVLDGWAVPLVQCTSAAVAVLGARARGYSWPDLALSPTDVATGVRLGGAGAAVVVVGVALVAAVPTTRGFFDDERFVDLTSGETIYEIAIRIPIVTALTEELLFRAVLLAVLLTAMSTRRAVLVSSVAFGLWHVLTTSGDLDENATTDDLGGWEVVLSVAGIVAVTAAAGAAFAWFRLRSRSIVAPWLVHTAINGSTFVAGVIVAG